MLPYLAAQPSAKVLAAASAAAQPAAVLGDGLTATRAWMVLWHTIGELWPTPRGSNATRSKWLRISGARPGAQLWRKSIAEAPGPPGLASREPIRCEGLVAGNRVNARRIVPFEASA